MTGFIAKQPNGLYCRFSTVVDTVTHYNMTEKDYLKNVTGTVSSPHNGIDTLEHYLKPFSYVIESFQPDNMTQIQFDEIVKEMSKTPTKQGYKTT